MKTKLAQKKGAMIKRILLMLIFGYLSLTFFVSFADELSKSIPEQAGSHGLIPISPDFKVVKGSEIVIENMPRLLSQGALGICYATAVTTLFNHAHCIDKKISLCRAASDDIQASQLDMIRFSRNIKDKDFTDRFAYEGLPVNDGGGVALTLYHALSTASVASASCAPIGNLVADVYSLEELKIELKKWQRFKNAYAEYKNIKKACDACSREYAITIGASLKEDFHLKTSNEEILDGFSSDSYEKFLDKILIAEHCWDFEKTLVLSSRWTQKMFPNYAEAGDYFSFIQKIKEALAKQSPVALGYCTQTPLKVKSQEECDNIRINGIRSGQGHALVVKGYRQVCNSKKKCKDSLQVQNSWGQKWQDNNNDGWIDAKELLDRTFYQSQQMTWLEDKTN